MIKQPIRLSTRSSTVVAKMSKKKSSSGKAPSSNSPSSSFAGADPGPPIDEAFDDDEIIVMESDVEATREPSNPPPLPEPLPEPPARAVEAPIAIPDPPRYQSVSVRTPAPTPPTITVPPKGDAMSKAEDMKATKTEAVEAAVRDYRCTTRHIANCDCKGAARLPIDPKAKQPPKRR